MEKLHCSRRGTLNIEKWEVNIARIRMVMVQTITIQNKSIEQNRNDQLKSNHRRACMSRVTQVLIMRMNTRRKRILERD
jgi:hypothetical protein